MIRRIVDLLGTAVAHPHLAAMGAREFRSTVGMSWDDPTRSDAYDAGRELAHITTRRRWDW